MTVQADDEAAIDLDGLLAGIRTVAEVNAMIRGGSREGSDGEDSSSGKKTGESKPAD